jgi:hypothetical protein
VKPGKQGLDWSLTDGWLLMALHFAQTKSGAQLKDVIAAADLFNHSIPSAEEFTDVLTKFMQCGLVAIKGNRILLLPRYSRKIRGAYQARGGLFMTADKGLKWLMNSRLVTLNNHQVKFSRRQVNSAYKAYVQDLVLKP